MEQEIKLTDQPESTPEITVPVKYNKEINDFLNQSKINLDKEEI